MPSPLISFRLPPPLADKLAQLTWLEESLSQTAQRLLFDLLESDLSEKEPTGHRVLAVEARLASLEARLASLEKGQTRLSHQKK